MVSWSPAYSELVSLGWGAAPLAIIFPDFPSSRFFQTGQKKTPPEIPAALSVGRFEWLGSWWGSWVCAVQGRDPLKPGAGRQGRPVGTC